MKFSFLYLLLLLPILAIAQNSDQNWVKTKTYKVPTANSLATPTPAQAVTQVSYFDGLGRAIQQVAHAQSNSGKDIVTHIEYDAFGRPSKEFLPYANQNASLNFNASANSDVLGFYATDAYENTSNPFSEKQFEASPLNRVLKQAAPGDAWSLGSGKEIKLDYQTNTADDVKLYQATATWNATLGVYDIALSQTGHFAANQLYKTITYDENTPPLGAGGLEEYKDKEGKVILKRTFNNSIAHETYYVYDQFGNLTYVIPPLVTSVSTELDGLCYQYKYDARNRLVEKKLPGKQWEYIVYDKLDRVVATGPAYNPWVGSDSDNGWLITKYDAFNRPVYTGWYDRMATATSSDRKSLQAMIDGNETISENKSTETVTIEGVAIKYTNQVSPSTFILLTVNYYDNYDYPSAPTIPSQIEGQNTQSTNLKGMPTGSWVRVLDAAGSTSNELSYTVYDTKYRPIRSYTKNYLGGYTQVDSKLDWAGKTQYTVTSQKRTASGQLFTVKERFTYSAQDRLIKHTHEIVGALPEQLLTLNTYDELGQLLAKNVGGTDVTGAQALQKVNYTYNIRGWLTAINDVDNLMPSSTEKDLFAFKINYNNPETASPLFNGNISETFWKTSSDNKKRKYAYQYDNLNRLLEANYGKEDLNTLDNYLEKLSYDKAGNILTLERNGNLDPSGGAPVNQIDKLEYSYHPQNKNLLLKVNDISGSPQGFDQTNDIATGDVDANNEDHTDDYTYDFNGNMKTDTNKGIEGITYNHLNLPTKILFSGTTNGNVSYIYNAIGGKVKKVVEDNVANTTTDYLTGFQYKNTELQFFPHAEGYVHYTKPLAAQGGENSALGSFNYVFNYTDHLGNVRVSYAKDPLLGNRVKILEENHYYAFGLKHKNYNVERLDFDQFPDTGVELVSIPAVANASYNYKYNGKELQEELGLNWLDYGWRNYDPAISRWVTPDPLLNDLDFTFDDSQVDEDDEEEVYEAIITKAENGDGIFNPNNLNSYGYGYNNPVSFDDPDGRCVPCIVIVALLYSSIADAPTRNPQADAKGRAAIKEIQNTHLSLLIPGSGGSKPVTAVLNVAKQKATEKVKEQVKKIDKLRETAKTGQEAHRQIQKDLKAQGAKTEVNVKLSNGKTVRKDAVRPDGTKVIIKPNTPSGNKSAVRREILMKKNGHKTEIIKYNPKSPKYQPGSPSYIGPKIKK
jgi:RHS repeat-associated protein